MDAHRRPMMPDDVISTRMHVGFVVSYDPNTGEGLSVSAPTLAQRVVLKNWGFRPGEAPTVRRYVGQ